MLAGVVDGAAIIPAVGQHGGSPVEGHGQRGRERQHVDQHGNVDARRDRGRTLAGPIEADSVSALSEEIAHPQSLSHAPDPRTSAALSLCLAVVS